MRVTLLDLTTGNTQSLGDHFGDRYQIIFSPDNRHLLSLGDGNSMQLWSVETGELMRVFSTDSSSIYDAVFSADGRTIRSISADGTLRTWDTDYHDFIEYAWTRIYRDFTPEERRRFGLEDGECPYRGQ
jgi:WD40 repeat protein